MASNVQYEILSLVEGEKNNKVVSILENKYKSPAKRVTLNERFGVLEKGYMLHATEPTETKNAADVYLFVHEKNLISKKEFIQNYLAKNPIVDLSEENVEEDKENVSSRKSTTPAVSKKETTSEDYVRDIAKSILKAI
ncbi:Protein CBG17949 [Caenorhabditis briggsae]|uniref:Uncharacterized protein n=2 Tax=Caenorhabditis briggsae TaxID=6238 RepID=A0AAE9EJQ0_CAEBR|nr:Protein CBG17949 [Caenorhabditis briggsae]ULU00877.1 hypothetical protein L3Y34_001357 [Caenorhabditis briggsae]UMM23546.1 hypothetical protein L5515_004214 [Caenorhabditis briggsae]CAP35482.1 Protein CBG17949 [Caenorhabditis briggsae]